MQKINNNNNNNNKFLKNNLKIKFLFLNFLNSFRLDFVKFIIFLSFQ